MFTCKEDANEATKGLVAVINGLLDEKKSASEKDAITTKINEIVGYYNGLSVIDPAFVPCLPNFMANLYLEADYRPWSNELKENERRKTAQLEAKARGDYGAGHDWRYNPSYNHVEPKAYSFVYAVICSGHLKALKLILKLVGKVDFLKETRQALRSSPKAIVEYLLLKDSPLRTLVDKCPASSENVNMVNARLSINMALECRKDPTMDLKAQSWVLQSFSEDALFCLKYIGKQLRVLSKYKSKSATTLPEDLRFLIYQAIHIITNPFAGPATKALITPFNDLVTLSLLASPQKDYFLVDEGKKAIFEKVFCKGVTPTLANFAEGQLSSNVSKMSTSPNVSGSTSSGGLDDDDKPESKSEISASSSSAVLFAKTVSSAPALTSASLKPATST